MKIELLSPAKNIECGIEAINHGADAVYIGAKAFGARVSAPNSFDDIETLINYAHKFNARVYVTLNTILSDKELVEAEAMINKLYNIGADALIIQDFGILALDLPNIEIHASTQTDNRTLQKVKFLEDVGFSRVILARELSLKQVKKISDNTNIELEAFVHGSLCVSYSGNCYISEFGCGRSANMGNCAQYCRRTYSLVDGNGNTIIDNKYLLSLKDLDRSIYLKEMIDAGITSFKIEGRLKDVDYVKNITAYYRNILDDIIEDNNLERLSVGKSTISFNPNPKKTFNRGSTDYFLVNDNRGKDTISNINTSKSVGEFIGNVGYIANNYFVIKNNDVKLNNGDGICYFNSKTGNLEGFQINKVDGNKIFPNTNKLDGFNNNVDLYRNFDVEFNKLINKKTAERKVAIDVEFIECDNGFDIVVKSEDGVSVKRDFNIEKEVANKKEVALANIKKQLSKLGDTIYSVNNFEIKVDTPPFIPSSTLSEWKRDIIDFLDKEREKNYYKNLKKDRKDINNDVSYFEKNLDYRANVMNKKAYDFYVNANVESIDYAMEKRDGDSLINSKLPPKTYELMRCKHCIRRTINACFIDNPNNAKKLHTPLYLIHGTEKYLLDFDCKKCEMIIYNS